MYRNVMRVLYDINRRTAVNLGLENSLKLHRVLEFPSEKIPIIHVAGTNVRTASVPTDYAQSWSLKTTENERNYARFSS